MFVQRSLSLVISSHNIFSKVIFVNSFLPLPLKWGYFTRNTVSFICQSLHSILVPRTSCMIDIYICLCIYVFVGIGSESQHAGSSLCHTALSLQRMDSPYAVHGARGSWSNPCPRRCKVDSWPLEQPGKSLYCSVFMKYKAHSSWYPVLQGLVNTWPRMRHHSTTPCYVYQAAPYLFFLKVKLFIRINDFMGAYSVFFSFFLLK